MVFMAMGQHQRQDVLAPFDQIADVRQDEIDAGQILFAAERNAAINDQPFSSTLVAETVNREVHPDLADAAKACEYQFVLRHAASARPAERTLPAAHNEGEHIAGCNFGDATVGSLEH